MKNIFIFLLIPFTTFVLNAQENLREDINRYTPYNIAEIREIGQNVKFNPRGVKDEMESRLNEFYLSDPTNRKIQQRQVLETSTDTIYKREWNTNIQRLFIRDLLSEKAEQNFVKEAPNLYLMHKTLAQAYIELGKPYQAAWNYSMSLSYRRLRFSPEVFTNEDRLALLEPNDPEIAAANRYSEALRRKNAADKNFTKTRQRIELLQDNLRSPVSTQTRSDLTRELQQQETAFRDVAQERTQAADAFAQAEDEYSTREQNYNRESAALLVEVAELTRTLEDAIKEREKVLNKKALYKTSFNQSIVHDYSENRQFTAYANLLEMASHLFPESPEISLKLAEEYESSLKVDRAIYYYEQTLLPDRSQNISDDTKRKVSRSLGALYYQTNKYVDSAWHYENAYAQTTDEKEKQNLSYHLALLHARHTGNFKRAVELFENHLTYLNTMNPTVPETRADWLMQKFQSYQQLYYMREKRRENSKALEAMNLAIDSERELSNLIDAQSQKLNELNGQIQEAKKPLLEDTQEKDFNQLLRLEREYELERARLGRLETAHNSLPLGKVYFQYARALESHHDIRGAMSVYREAEQKGIAPSASRREMDRLRKLYAIE